MPVGSTKATRLVSRKDDMKTIKPELDDHGWMSLTHLEDHVDLGDSPWAAVELSGPPCTKCTHWQPIVHRDAHGLELACCHCPRLDRDQDFMCFAPKVDND